ncbi:beta-alanyl-bioamine nonribosomal peptide synthetase ebony-like [Glandiceps talaboti]
MDKDDSLVYSIMEGEDVPILQTLPSTTIHGLFNYIMHSKNEEVKSKPAIIYNDVVMTFDELDRYSDNLVAILKMKLKNKTNQTETEKTSLIGIHVYPSDKMVVALLAVLKMGAAYVPLDPDYPMQWLQHIIEESQPMCILASKGTSLMKQHREGTNDNLSVICINDIWTETISSSGSQVGRACEWSDDEVKGQNPLACILYTSGRTGVPKGVCLSHESILHRLVWQWKTFPFSKDDIGCFKTTLNFVDSLSESFGFILQGRPTVTIDRDVTRDPEQLLRVLHAHKVTRITVVPSLLSSILSMVSHSDRRQILDISQTLKFWVCSGEELPSQLLKEFFSTFAESNLANFYGSTEVTGDVTYMTFNKTSIVGIGSQVPIGKPIYNTGIYILDEDKRPVPVGEVGGIYVSGQNLAMGYFNDKEETAKSFFEHTSKTKGIAKRLFKMGDFGRMVYTGDKIHQDQHLSLIFEGSEVCQVKVRGNRVNLHEVENVLSEISGIEATRVHCYKQSLFDQIIVAFCSFHQRGVGRPSVSDMKDYLKKKLPMYMIPEIVAVQNWPLLPNGKINNDALRKMFDDSRSSCSTRDHPGTIKTESQDVNLTDSSFMTLVDVISETLQISADQIHHKSDFFMLGGNSVNAVQVVSELRKLGLHVTLGEFFKSTSVVDIAKRVHKIQHETEQPVIDETELNNWESALLNDFEIVQFSAATAIEKESAMTLLSRQMTTHDLISRALIDSGTFSHEELFAQFYEYAKCLLEKTNSSELSFFVKEKGSDNIIVAYLIRDGDVDLHQFPDLQIHVIRMVENVCESLVDVACQNMNVPYGTNYLTGCLLVIADLPMNMKVDLTMLSEKHLCDTARRGGYRSVWCFNVHPVMKRVCNELGYVVRQKKKLRDLLHEGKRILEKIQPPSLELEFATKDT